MQLVKIRKRPTPKRQAMDAVASVAKVWSEWQLAKRAGRGVAKGAKTAGKAAVVWRLTPMKTLAVVGGAAAGIGALWALKSRKGGAEPWSVPADETASPPPPPPTAGGLGANGPSAPGTDPDRIKISNDPPATAHAFADEGSNGVTKITDEPAAAPEAEAATEAEAAPEADDAEPEAAATEEPDAEADQPEADDAAATKVSDKPADD